MYFVICAVIKDRNHAFTCTHSQFLACMISAEFGNKYVDFTVSNYKLSLCLVCHEECVDLPTAL